MSPTATYTIETISRTDTLGPRGIELAEFCLEVGKRTAHLYRSDTDWSIFPFIDYVIDHRVTIARRQGRIVGIMLARLDVSTLQPDKMVLFQDLLYAEPGTRAAKLLLDDFIDFGRRNANHIVTCIGSQTNIKVRSLARLGFKKLETHYWIEVKPECPTASAPMEKKISGGPSDIGLVI